MQHRNEKYWLIQNSLLYFWLTLWIATEWRFTSLRFDFYTGYPSWHKPHNNSMFGTNNTKQWYPSCLVPLSWFSVSNKPDRIFLDCEMNLFSLEKTQSNPLSFIAKVLLRIFISSPFQVGGVLSINPMIVISFLV